MTTPTPHPARSHLTLVDDRSHPAGGRGANCHLAPEPDPGRSAPPEPGSQVAGSDSTARPGFRRRTGWFEANPGCFGRAALVACGVGFTAGGASAWAAWRLRRSPAVRLALRTFSLSRRFLRRSSALRRRLAR